MSLIYNADNISKVFSNNGAEVVALDGVNLVIEHGETVGIIGVSGSGKSTLLHILGALDRPTSGTIHLDNTDLFKYSDEKLSDIRNREIGFVFQFHYLLPEFTALENVMLPCLINRSGKKEARNRAEEILNKVGLADRIHHKPGELSGGEQQRVSVARAVVQKPSIILADEPTGNLDLKTGLSIIDLFLKLNDEDDITLVIVTHDHNIANKMSRTITLSDGKIVNVQ